MSFQLYDYQAECLATIAGRFLTDHIWSQIAVLPTGAGKTEIFSRLRQSPIGAWLEQYPAQRQKMIVIAQRERLIDQAARKIQRANPDLFVGVEMGQRRAGMMDDVIVGSVQTLAGRRLERIDPERVRIVVIDEAHHVAADSYQAILRHFGLVPPADLIPRSRSAEAHATARERVRDWWAATERDRLLLGFTATPNRADAVGLEWTFRQIVYEKSLRWMIERGYLSPLRGFAIDTALSLDGVKITAGDFNQGQLAEAVNTPARNRAAVAAWAERAMGRKTLAFTVDIQHARDLAAAYAQVTGRQDGQWVSGEDPDQASKLARFQRGDLMFLANAQLLTEGYDQPDVSAIVMAKPTTSHALYMQMVGRGTRLAPGKADCLVLDVVDVSRRHSLLMLGDLFGLPRRFDLRGDEAVATVAAIEQIQTAAPELSLYDEGLTLNRVRAMAREIDLWSAKEAPLVAALARLAWVEDSAARYHLTLPGRRDDGTLAQAAERVEIREDLLAGWRVVHVAAGETVDIGTADDLAAAFQRGERWVEMRRPDVARMKDRNAGWRKKQPTDKQRAFLQRCKAPRWNDPALTRGEASAMMDRFLRKRS